MIFTGGLFFFGGSPITNRILARIFSRAIRHSARVWILARSILSCANVKARRVIALVAVVKKSRRVVRVIRFGLTVFGIIIAVSRSFIALCGWVSAAGGGERCFLSRSIDGDTLATARGTEVQGKGKRRCRS